MPHRHLPTWMHLLDRILPEDPEPFGRDPTAPRPKLRTRVRDWLGLPRPADEPPGFEW